jgi:hypothetical protein
MKIFISSSILQFKTRFIPGGCAILPMQGSITGGANTVIANLKWLNPSEIICETDRIFRVISPYFRHIPVVIMNYSDGVEYCGNPIKNKMNYVVISAYFVLFIYTLILDNFIQAIFLAVIYITVFLGVILWYSDREEWEAGGKRIAHA